jgi:hypothetical protein
MTSSRQTKTRPGRTQVWLLSIPALLSFAILCLWPVLPHTALRFGASGFDVFNVWVILAGPIAGLALLSLRHASLMPVPKVFLGILNAGAVVLSVCLLLVAAGL